MVTVRCGDSYVGARRTLGGRQEICLYTTQLTTPQLQM